MRGTNIAYVHWNKCIPERFSLLREFIIGGSTVPVGTNLKCDKLGLHLLDLAAMLLGSRLQLLQLLSLLLEILRRPLLGIPGILHVLNQRN